MSETFRGKSPQPHHLRSGSRKISIKYMSQAGPGLQQNELCKSKPKEGSTPGSALPGFVFDSEDGPKEVNDPGRAAHAFCAANAKPVFGCGFRCRTSLITSCTVGFSEPETTSIGTSIIALTTVTGFAGCRKTHTAAARETWKRRSLLPAAALDVFKVSAAIFEVRWCRAVCGLLTCYTFSCSRRRSGNMHDVVRSLLASTWVQNSYAEL